MAAGLVSRVQSRILHVDLEPAATVPRAAASDSLGLADFPVRRELGQRLHAILGDFSTRIEPLAPEQCWLDVTRNNAGLPSAIAVARRIRERIRIELGLQCAIGVAPLRFVAKIAADGRRPDGLTVVTPDQVPGFLRPLPVHRLWGVGPVTTRRLAARGIATIGELADLSEDAALELLGRAHLHLWRMANGNEAREVRPSRRSRGQERTFPVDVYDPAVLRRELERQTRDVCADLARAGETARTVTVKVRYRNFETVTRTRTRDAATHHPSLRAAGGRPRAGSLRAASSRPRRDADRLVELAIQLLTERTEVGRRPVRLVGVQLSGLVPTGPQLPLPFTGR